MDQQSEDSSTTPEQEPQAAAPPTEGSSPPPVQEAATSPNSELSADSKNMGMLCHLLALSGIIIPLGSILGPLILWLVKKETDPYVDEQGKESLNFQISVLIYGIVSAILMLAVIGIFLIFVVAIGWLVLTIIGTIKASKGEPWKYPVTIRFIK